MGTGALFVVATPIGNLEDITLRALRVLREVDLVAAEDTRRTAKLLARYEIRRPLTSYREHNEARATPKLIARLEAGESIALTTDAGTPGISDPGSRLVAAAFAAGIAVVPIPGPSAVSAALSVSGLAIDEFVFMGFPPASGKARRQWFERLSTEARAVVLFEAPHRIHKTLAELATKVNRPINIFRELTKLNETLVNAPNMVSLPDIPERGEFVLVLGQVETDDKRGPVDSDFVYRIYCALEQVPDIGRQVALEVAAAAARCSVQDAKRIVKKVKFSGK